MKEKNRIPKLVLTQDQIESNNSWRLSQRDLLERCDICGSNLFYFEKIYGVVVEDLDYGVLGYKEKRYFALREIGLNLYCAECGDFHEDFTKWFYPEDRVIMTFDEIEDTEKVEIDYCLNQYNQKHDFTPRYKNMHLNELKEKLDEYVKNNPEPKDLKRKVTKK